MIANKKIGLVLTRTPKKGYTYINLGRVLSSALQNEDSESSFFSIKAYDALRQLLSEGIHQDADRTDYIAITNFNILFEPALKMNLRAIVEDYAKRILLILHIPQPLGSSTIYYPFPEDHAYSLDLTGLSLITC